jgi:hypothetical protein
VETAFLSNEEKIALELGTLVKEKGEAYGDSVSLSEKIMRLLYPCGVGPHQYLDALCLVRLIDKMSRIANKKDAFGENPWRDIAGYAIRMLIIENQRKK